MPSLKLPVKGPGTSHQRGSFDGPEFPPGILDEPASRRGVLQHLGVGAAIAALAGCLKQPDEKILPYTRQPEEIVPGNPLHYATASVLGGRAVGLIATSNEGRPTKLEGNPQHPGSRGRTGPLEQAALLSLYDPQRLKVPRSKELDRSWRDFLAAMAAKGAALKKTQGEGLRFLLEPSSSPLVGSLRKRLRDAWPKARFSSWTALPVQSQHDGAQLALGGAYDTRVALDKATVIAALDADVLSGLPGTLQTMRAWAAKRDPGAGPMNRLYAVEAHFSVTGMNADHRLRVKPTAVARIAVALLKRAGGARYAALAEPKLDEKQRRFVDALARDLAAAGAGAVVLAGDRQPPAVHAIAHALNAVLGSAAISYAAPVLHDTDAGPRALTQLAEEIRGGKVDTLVITAWNPVYGAPADIDFATALSAVPTSVYLAAYEDETAARSSWVLPAVHTLESWQDARAADGTVTLVQPLIAPLFGGVHEVEVLSALLGEGDRSAYTQLRAQYATASEAAWEKWLQEGFVEGTAARPEAVTVRHDAVLAEARKIPADDPPGLQLNVIPDYRVWDGRFANNPWLQELPDPVTKITWENVAIVSPKTAEELGLEQGDRVDLGVRGPPTQGPIVILPGHADGVVTVSMGYGRKGLAENTARGLGFDTATLRHASEPWFTAGLALVPRGEKEKLAQTQEVASMQGRLIAVSATAAQLPEVEREVLEKNRGMPETYHQPVDYSRGYKWGMGIDLTRCTGCNACMVACQAENNVPVVGKDRVWRSREMHWLRVDRYFTGPAEDPGVVFQPLACVHCETAPCEYVCPVNATVHSDEGLNEMVYNRCVGTRYCSNNCPYKVRRFNFFRYTYDYTDTEKMVFNPDVTVRARGVMEKCTYCVQRIERVRIKTRVEGGRIDDGNLQAACQQACPTDAIVFGDLNQPEAKVTRAHEHPRRYDLLHELGTRPRTAYLARVTNPNPELA